MFARILRTHARVSALLLMVCFALPLAAADQAGAEKTKVPVKATVVDAVKWGTESIGNIEVVYADGTRDRWTTKGSCGMPRVSADGTVGWTVFEAERPAKTASYNIRPNGTIVLCRQGKVLFREQAAMGFIEEWDFLKDGKQFVVKSRALHGPATIELRETETGKVVAQVKTTTDECPDWAKPFWE